MNRISCLLLSLTLYACIGLKAQTRVYFESSKYDLSSATRQTLDSLARTLINVKHVSVAGYCDSTGTATFNKTLSENRAKAVANYLRVAMMPKVQVYFRGFSAYGPVATNSTEEGKQLNRRVEITVEWMPVKVPKDSLEAKPAPQKTEIAVPTPEPTPQKTEPVADSSFVPREPEKIIKDEEFVKLSDDSTLLRLRNMNYVGGQDVLLGESYPSLHYLLEVMQQFPKLKIKVEGHICCEPKTTSFGMDLSIRRAKTVVEYLKSCGIDSSRLTFQGFGADRKLTAELDEFQKKENRRVEIRLLNDKQSKSDYQPINYSKLEKIVKRPKRFDRIETYNLAFNVLLPQLKPYSFKQLDSLVALLEQHPLYQASLSMQLPFQSNTKEYMQALSLIPIHYLVSKGIDPARLHYEGYGFGEVSEREMQLRAQYYGKIGVVKLECVIWVPNP